MTPPINSLGLVYGVDTAWPIKQDASKRLRQDAQEARQWVIFLERHGIRRPQSAELAHACIYANRRCVTFEWHKLSKWKLRHQGASFEHWCIALHGKTELGKRSQLSQGRLRTNAKRIIQCKLALEIMPALEQIDPALDGYLQIVSDQQILGLYGHNGLMIRMNQP